MAFVRALCTWLFLLLLPAWIGPATTSRCLVADISKRGRQERDHVGDLSSQAEPQLFGRRAASRELQQVAGSTASPGRSGSVLVWGDLTLMGPTPSEAMNGKIVKIAAGFHFGMALLDTHEVVTWSLFTASSLNVPPGIQGVTADIAAGSAHAVALLLNGTVVAWGGNDYGQLGVPNMLQPGNGTVKAVRVISSAWHSLALLANGSVVAWGRNNNNQSNVPLAALANVTSIAASSDTSLAVLSNGTLLEWGLATSPPLQQGVASIAIGVDQVVAVLRNGSTTSWPAGDAKYPDILQQVTTVPTGATSNVLAVSASENVSMALLNTGEVVAWGWTPPGTQPLSPVPEAARSKVMAIAAGYGYAMALVEGTFPAPTPPPPPPPSPPPSQPAQQGATPSVIVWGDIISLGQQPLSTSTGIVKIAAGFTFAMALTDKGEVVAWSADNTTGQSNVPPSIQGLVVDIAAGYTHALAVLSNGSVVGWGSNDNSQTDVPPELQQAGQAKVVSIAAGLDHSMALLNNGSVIAWGGNSWGQTLVPDRARANVAAISAGSQISLAVLSDGTLVQWGAATSQIDVETMGVLSAAAGTDQAVAVLRNGTVVSWFAPGRLLTPANPSILNDLLAVPAEATSHVVAVAAQQNVSMALLDTGRVVAWGWTPPGVSLSKVPLSAQSNVIAIAAGGGFAMALTSTGRMTSPPTPARTTDGGSTGVKLSTASVVGIVIGVVALVAALTTGALLLFKLMRGKGNTSKLQAHSVQKSGPSWQALKGTAVWDQLVRVLRAKEAFMRSVAQEYSWILRSSLAGAIRNVEAGVNDTQLDMLQLQGPSTQPVVELSRSELRDQVHLLADGLLGRGATALVFKCVWPSRFGPDSLLAIKVLKDGSDADVSAVQSFAYEAKLLASLRHPNVVRVYGYCLEPPTVCLILELLPTSLKQRLYGAPSGKPEASHNMASNTNATNSATAISNPGSSTQVTNPSKTYNSSHLTAAKAHNESSAALTDTTHTRPTADPYVVVDVLPEPLEPNHNLSSMTLLEIVRTSTDISAGLAYLHSQEEPVIPELEDAGLVQQPSSTSPKDKRIVHRDLKPANILLNSEGGAKITDFGLARDHDHTTVGGVNMGAGTMPYMAPEQLTAARVGRAGISATNRVDVYSLGMMMWEMLAGEVPWKGKSEDMIFAVVMNHRRPPLPGQPVTDGGDLVSVQEPLQRHVPGLYDHPLLPELNHIIQQCWQQRDRKRPTAAAVHDMLQQLLKKLETDSAA